MIKMVECLSFPCMLLRICLNKHKNLCHLRNIHNCIEFYSTKQRRLYSIGYQHDPGELELTIAGPSLCMLI